MGSVCMKPKLWVLTNCLVSPWGQGLGAGGRGPSSELRCWQSPLFAWQQHSGESTNTALPTPDLPVV